MESKGDLRISRILLNAEVALLQLHSRILRCEEKIFDSNFGGDGSLQDLDFIAQSLESLAQFLGCVSANVKEDQTIELQKPLNKVVLESLAGVLSSDAPSEESLSKLAGLHAQNGVDLF